MRSRLIIYPVLSAFIAMIISVIVVVLTRAGFAEALKLRWFWGVGSIAGAGMVLLTLSGLLAMPTLRLARCLDGLSRLATVNLAALVYFIGAVFCYVSIFTVNEPFGFVQWIEAVLAMVFVLAFCLRVSFLPVIVIYSNRQK